MPYDATRTDKFPYGRLVVAPCVGDVVHYVPKADGMCGCYPATVQNLYDGLTVDLIMDLGGADHGDDAPYDQDGRAPGTWHYGSVQCQQGAAGVNEPAVASQE